MKKIWYWLISIYAVIGVINFFVLTNLSSPGPTIFIAVIGSVFWPIFWILFILNAIFGIFQ